jgi:orotidine-5'-phosphate decarboxylase
MASVEAARLGVKMFNMHTLGGYEMMAMAMDALDKEFKGGERAKALGVTILTSSNEQTFRDMGLEFSIPEMVVRLAKLAQRAGLDGVVASAQEAAMIRQACGKDFLIVTPGIRPAEASADDQVRIATPAGAIKNGADFLVIGRPIIGKPKGERLGALELINAEVETALAE